VVRAGVDYGPPSVEKALGALPVIAEFCRRLDIAGIVDRACPVRDLALVTHGQVIEALIANRLTSPAPLVHVEDWARAWATEEVFAIDPAALNDDRVGRALDAVAPELNRIVGSVGAGAIASFGIDVARMHWDMTSISLYGNYESPIEEFVEPRYGHPKDRRPDLKQVQTGLGVTADGGVPVFHRAYDGGAGEVAQVVPAMEALKEMAGEQHLLVWATPSWCRTRIWRPWSKPRWTSLPRRRRPTSMPPPWPPRTSTRPLRSTTWPTGTATKTATPGASTRWPRTPWSSPVPTRPTRPSSCAGSSVWTGQARSTIPAMSRRRQNSAITGNAPRAFSTLGGP